MTLLQNKNDSYYYFNFERSILNIERRESKNMIRCTNYSKTELRQVGHHIAKAFLSEKGSFSILPPDVADRMFSMIVEICYETGHLYTTSDKQEGYCVYWTKSERPGFWPQMKLVLMMMIGLPWSLGKLLKDGQNNWIPTEKRYKKQDDFVEVFLIAVRNEYQKQGYFRKMLEEPFSLAKIRHTICVLDTDSIVKAEKYCHVGMHIIDRKVQKNGIEMFALEK